MRVFVCAYFWLAAAPVHSADDPPPTLSTALPDGAVARFGAPEQRCRNEVYALAYSPDGKRIAVSIGYHVQILDAKSCAEIMLLSKPDWHSLIREVRFTADGKWLACQGMGDNQSPTLAQFWNVDEGKESERLLKGERVLIALSPDGKTAATLGREMVKNETGYHVVLWDALSGAQLREIPTEGLDGIHAIRFTADGKRLLVRQERGGWKSLEPGKKYWSKELKESPNTGSTHDHLQVSPDGKLHIHAHSQGVGSLTFWSAYDTTTGKPVEHFNRRPAAFVAFDADGQRFLECEYSYDHGLLDPIQVPHLFGLYGLKKSLSGSFGILRLCETATTKVLQQWIVPIEQIRATAFSPDGKALLIGVSSSLRKLDVRPGDIAPRVGWWRNCSNDLRYSRDGKTLYVWELDGRSRTACDSSTGIVRCHLRSDVAMDVGTLKRPTELLQLKDGKLEPATGSGGFQHTPPKFPHYSVIRSPDGKFLIAFAQVQTGYSMGSGIIHYGPGMPVELWQSKPLKRIATSATEKVEPQPIRHFALEALGGGTGPQAHSIGFAPDGSRYAWADFAGTVHIWELPDGRALPPLKLRDAGSGAFSHDGRLLAVSGKDDLSVLEIASGTVRFKFGDKTIAAGIAISPDESRIAASHAGTSILIWKALPAIERGKDLDEMTWQRHWAALGEANAANAWPAMCQLLADLDRSPQLLCEKLLSLSVPDSTKRVRELIEQMTDDTYRLRRDAELELQRIGYPALGALEKAAKSTTSEDLAVRSRKVIEKIQANFPTPSTERMQAQRGVEVLERIATAEARTVLRALADNAVDAQVRLDAERSQARLK